MTDEQIKQNAANYYEHIINDDAQYRFACNCFVAGAHSRDKEVNDLEKALTNVNELCHQQRNKIYELRHPWVKADERKPKESKDQHGFSEVVILRSDKGECMTGFYHYDTDTWYLYAGSMTRDDQIFGRIVEWMKIPK